MAKHTKKDVKKDTPNLFLRFPYIWIGVLCFLIYGHTISYKIVNLDDKIFLEDEFNVIKKTSNFTHYFNRGIFAEKNDDYYRPLLLTSFMLDAQIAGKKLKPYHVTNIIYHIIAVSLLFVLFLRLNFERLNAFLLTLIFAVHPVLCAAVSWIPGRNDPLLAIFIFSSFIFFLDYVDSKKISSLFFHFAVLLLALFTKETAVVFPVVLTAYIIIYRIPLKNSIYLLPGWMVLIITWYLMRKAAIIPTVGLTLTNLQASVFHNLPLPLQYFGKIILPVNLSVFPMVEDTPLWPGILALIIVGALLFFSPYKNIRNILFGVLWFLILITPALFVPLEINKQAFEHRLYVPIVGILIVLHETLLFVRKKEESYVTAKLAITTAVILTLGITTFLYSYKFKEKYVFWKDAVQTSPHSSYAHLLFGLTFFTKDNYDSTKFELKKALAIDSTERRVNYFLGECYKKQGNLKEAIDFYKQEDKINPNLFQNLFELAHVYFMVGQRDSAAKYLEKVEKVSPGDVQTHNNLFIYYSETHQYNKALYETIEMEKCGQPFPKETIDRMVNEAKYYYTQNPTEDNLFKLAHIYFSTGQQDSSVTYLQRVEQLNPKNVLVHNNLYIYYKEKKQYSKALFEADELGKYGEPVNAAELEHLKKEVGVSK